MTVAAGYAGIRAVVLGATGFIGGHVARALSARGARVAVVGRDATRLLALARSLAGTADCIELDLTHPGAALEAVQRAHAAVVFNLAAYGVRPAERDPDLAAQLNTDLPAALARAMTTGGDPSWHGQQVVHTGSALEYGTASGDLDERTPCTPTTLYGRTKLAGTQRLADAAQQAGVRAVTARLFTAYGPDEPSGRLLPTLLAAARTGAPIPLTAGTQLRDFTFVGDVVEGLLRLGALPTAEPGVVNLATGTLTTVRRFVESAAEVLGIAPARLVFGALPGRDEEMHHDPVATGRLRTLCGWVPSVAVRDGVARTAITPLTW